MSSPDLSEAERNAVAEVLQTPRLSMGPQEKAFEAAIAERVGARFGIAVSSGTAGLHLCVRAAGVSDGDVVLTTPFSFVSSTNVILFERAVPLFVDVDPVTGNLDPVMAAEAVNALQESGSPAEKWLPRRGAEKTGRLKALLSVDVFGQPADYDALSQIADQAQISIIEDSCEALGSTYHHRSAGMLGTAGVFAFYPNKQVTTGEGGLVVTDQEEWADTIRALRNQGRAPGDTWLEHTYLGYNYRMDEMSAALGVIQMSRLDELLAGRAQVADWYWERLETIPGVEAPQIVASTTSLGWFVYVIRLDPQIDRDGLIARLDKLGVPARPYFAPIHLMQYMRERFSYQPGDFPIAEDLGRRSIALPFSGVMPEEDVAYVCDALLTSLG